MLEMVKIHITKSNGIILSYRGHRYCKNRTTKEKIHWRCMVRCCLAPLQSNIFSNNQNVRVLSVGTHNYNATSYTKNDCKEIKQGNQIASKSLLHEERVYELNDDHNKSIGAEHYDIETVKICRCDEMNNYDNINLYCNTFNKYMKCMKEIEPPFLSAFLKDIESKIDICSILNEKEKESIEKQNADIEQPTVTATTNKSKRARDETSHNKEFIQKLKRRNQLQKWIAWKQK